MINEKPFDYLSYELLQKVRVELSFLTAGKILLKKKSASESHKD